jgi:very-short-patch-repair endonuclease
VVEVDGGQHASEVEKDEFRDRWLREHGFRVLRFWNNEVMVNLEGVVGRILDALNRDPHPTLSQGERE